MASLCKMCPIATFKSVLWVLQQTHMESHLIPALQQTQDCPPVWMHSILEGKPKAHKGSLYVESNAFLGQMGVWANPGHLPSGSSADLTLPVGPFLIKTALVGIGTS